MRPVGTIRENGLPAPPVRSSNGKTAWYIQMSAGRGEGSDAIREAFLREFMKY